MDSILEFLKNETFLVILGAAFLLLEYFLGKTEIVKAGSTLEAVLMFLKKLLEFFGIGKKDDKVLKSVALIGLLSLAGCGLLGDKEEDKPSGPKPLPDPNRVCLQVTEANKAQLTAEFGHSCKVGDWLYKGAKVCSSTKEKCMIKQ